MEEHCKLLAHYLSVVATTSHVQLLEETPQGTLLLLPQSTFLCLTYRLLQIDNRSLGIIVRCVVVGKSFHRMRTTCFDRTRKSAMELNASAA